MQPEDINASMNIDNIYFINAPYFFFLILYSLFFTLIPMGFSPSIIGYNPIEEIRNMACLQLELFERTPLEIVQGEVRDLDDSLGNVRRGMFKRHDELEKKFKESRDEIESLKDALHLMRDQMKHYEAALFPESTGAFAEALSGLRSGFDPVSSSMMSSQSSSTGLSLPRK